MVIDEVAHGDVPDLLPLVRAYCDFYGATPSDEALLALSAALLEGVGGVPHSEGVQLLARDGAGAAIGFATVFWSWSTLSAGRIAIMNDLFVSPAARGTGTADALIEACRALARDRGALRLEWQTAKDNHRAQAVYDRVGGERSEWLDYGLTP